MVSMGGSPLSVVTTLSDKHHGCDIGGQSLRKDMAGKLQKGKFAAQSFGENMPQMALPRSL